jgi:regulator of sigma E protease
MSLLFTLAAFLLALGILVAVHEWGHYRMAVACGVRVLKFSIGFGPQLLRYKPKRQRPGQDTEFVISALPLGGYVRMLDKRDPSQTIAAHDWAHEFTSQSAGKRFLIVAAGPVANLLLAVLLYAGLAIWGMPQPAPILGAPAAQSAAALAGIQGGERVVQMAYAGEALAPVRSFEDIRWQALQAALNQRDLQLQLASGRTLTVALSHITSNGELDATFADAVGLSHPWLAPRLAEVLPASPAAAAGLQAGDTVLSIDGQRTADGVALLQAIRAGASASGARMQIWTLQRGNQTLKTQVRPHSEEENGLWVGKVGVALPPPEWVTVRLGPLASLHYGVQRSAEYAGLSVKMLWRMATGQASSKNLSGSLTIADMAGRSARLGLLPFISFLAVISVSLGVMNVLPIPLPALDGGYLVHYAVEILIGKTVSDATFAHLQRLGIAMIVVLMLVAHYNDMQRYFPQLSAYFMR